jgi:hypothetical protein
MMMEQPWLTTTSITSLQSQSRRRFASTNVSHAHHAEQAIPCTPAASQHQAPASAASMLPNRFTIYYAHRIPVAGGDVLESGIGRAHNIALSTLPGFTLPGRLRQQALLDPRHRRASVEVSQGPSPFRTRIWL